MASGEYTPGQLGLSAQNFVVTLYMEGIRPSAALGADRLLAEIDPDGSGPLGFDLNDAVRVTVVNVDLDIDSDNDNGLLPPDRDLAEAAVEDLNGEPGKLVASNLGDTDSDGIPDFADGYDRDGVPSDDDANPQDEFVPMVLEIPEPIDLSQAKIRFDYNGDASDPAGVTVVGGAYTPAAGHFRVWMEDGGQVRSQADYIAPGEYTATELGMGGTTRERTFYVEGIAASAALGAQRVLAQIDPDGAGPAGFMTEDAVRTTVAELSIKYPHGDPAQSATNWADRNSAEANVGNELTFTGSATPQVSTVDVPVEAEVTPAAAADWLRWTIDDVGPLQAEWSTPVTGDVHTGKGLINTATFTTPATGLPANNAAFGAKTVSLSVGSGVADTATVEIFYPRDGRNHPGGDQTPPGQGSSRSTNWFYYWNQTGAGDPDALFNSNTADGTAEVPAMKHWSQAMNFSKTEIWIDAPSATLAQRRDGSGQWVSGIDMFANVIKHENVHVQQIADADALLGTLNGKVGTIWEKGWSWNTLPNNHATPGADGKPGEAGVDDDADGTVDEESDRSEFFAPGSDDVDLDSDNDDVPNAGCSLAGRAVA